MSPASTAASRAGRGPEGGGSGGAFHWALRTSHPPGAAMLVIARLLLLGRCTRFCACIEVGSTNEAEAESTKGGADTVPTTLESRSTPPLRPLPAPSPDSPENYAAGALAARVPRGALTRSPRSSKAQLSPARTCRRRQQHHQVVRGGGAGDLGDDAAAQYTTTPLTTRRHDENAKAIRRRAVSTLFCHTLMWCSS